MSKKQPELAILTNIPTPYRVAFFETLAETIEKLGGMLHVFFCADTEPNRHWKIKSKDMQFSHTLLKGLHPTLFGTYAHINPTVVGAIGRRRPTWLLSAGAWNMPTVVLASAMGRRSTLWRLFWSEGHQDAVLHPTGLVAGIRRRCLARYDGFAVPNQRSADYLRQQLGDGVQALPLANTVDEQFFRPASADERAEARQLLGLPTNARVLFTAARLEPIKGVSELVEAWFKVPSTQKADALLAIAGEGSLRDVLKIKAQMASTDSIGVRLLGHLDAIGLRRWYWAADMFVLPSHRDPNPLSPIEASFCRLPLLLSGQAGNSQDLLLEAKTGHLICELTPEGIAHVLEMALKRDIQAWRDMGTKAHELVRSKFTRRSVAEGFVSSLLEKFPAELAVDSSSK